MTKRKTLLTDELALSLEERCAAYLRKGLRPDTDEFDRVCLSGHGRFSPRGNAGSVSSAKCGLRRTEEIARRQN